MEMIINFPVNHPYIATTVGLSIGLGVTVYYRKQIFQWKTTDNTPTNTTDNIPNNTPNSITDNLSNNTPNSITDNLSNNITDNTFLNVPRNIIGYIKENLNISNNNGNLGININLFDRNRQSMNMPQYLPENIIENENIPKAKNIFSPINLDDEPINQNIHRNRNISENSSEKVSETISKLEIDSNTLIIIKEHLLEKLGKINIRITEIQKSVEIIKNKINFKNNHSYELSDPIKTKLISYNQELNKTNLEVANLKKTFIDLNSESTNILSKVLDKKIESKPYQEVLVDENLLIKTIDEQLVHIQNEIFELNKLEKINLLTELINKYINLYIEEEKDNGDIDLKTYIYQYISNHPILQKELRLRKNIHTIIDMTIENIQKKNEIISLTIDNTVIEINKSISNINKNTILSEINKNSFDEKQEITNFELQYSTNMKILDMINESINQILIRNEHLIIKKDIKNTNILNQNTKLKSELLANNSMLEEYIGYIKNIKEEFLEWDRLEELLNTIITKEETVNFFNHKVNTSEKNLAILINENINYINDELLVLNIIERIRLINNCIELEYELFITNCKLEQKNLNSFKTYLEEKLYYETSIEDNEHVNQNLNKIIDTLLKDKNYNYFFDSNEIINSSSNSILAEINKNIPSGKQEIINNIPEINRNIIEINKNIPEGKQEIINSNIDTIISELNNNISLKHGFLQKKFNEILEVTEPIRIEILKLIEKKIFTKKDNEYLLYSFNELNDYLQQLSFIRMKYVEDNPKAIKLLNEMIGVNFNNGNPNYAVNKIDMNIINTLQSQLKRLELLEKQITTMNDFFLIMKNIKNHIEIFKDNNSNIELKEYLYNHMLNDPIIKNNVMFKENIEKIINIGLELPKEVENEIINSTITEINKNINEAEKNELIHFFLNNYTIKMIKYLKFIIDIIRELIFIFLQFEYVHLYAVIIYISLIYYTCYLKKAKI